jgi:hypothetical protein
MTRGTLSPIQDAAEHQVLLKAFQSITVDAPVPDTAQGEVAVLLAQAIEIYEGAQLLTTKVVNDQTIELDTPTPE